MTLHEHAQALTGLVRRFMAELRDYIQKMASETPPEQIVERVLAGIAAIGAAALLALPNSRRREGVVLALLAEAMRFVGRRAPA